MRKFLSGRGALLLVVALLVSIVIGLCSRAFGIDPLGSVLHTLATPGHTYGSVCYRCEHVLFTGDTLFAGGCGRTDLPGGDQKMLRQSLEQLSALAGGFTVYPGHGESTTLAREKQYNPYLR